MPRVERPHQREVIVAQWSAHVIHRAPADADGLGLARHRQRMRAVERRLALNRPAC
jgi:hypothetical protein